MSFPTLSHNPATINTQSARNTISIEFDGGYKQTRERNTRDLKKFTINYSLLNKTDKDLLIAHYDTVRGSMPFDWTNADTNTTYSVRYAKDINIKADGRFPNLYPITIELEEV